MFRRFANPLMSVLLLASLIPTTSISAQQDRDYSELEKVALAELKETDTPGAAVVVISGDRAVFVRGFGVANIETGVPVTTDTLFRIGGMSKFLVATVLISLAEEGKLDLNVSIGRYVKGLSRKLSRVTAQQLLSETAGIKEDHLRLGLYDDSALGNIVRSWKDDWLIAEPGRIQSDSHPGYAIAGLLIEEVAGKPFDDVMNEKLFSPLGMSRSTFRPLVAFTYPFAQGHRRSVNGQKPTVVRPFGANSVGWPSYSLFSTVSNFSRFLIAFLNGGKLDGRQVISQSVIARLAKAPTSGLAVGEEERYGLESAKYGSHHVLRGNYTWAGMRPLIRIVPDERFAIIVFSNGGSRHLTKTMEKAMQMFLGPPGKPDTIASESLPMTQAEMTGYLGTYKNERVMTLFLKDGRLFIRDDSPPGSLGSLTDNTELPVMKIGKNRFSISPVGTSGPTLFTFIAGHKGRIEYMNIGGRALKRK